MLLYPSACIIDGFTDGCVVVSAVLFLLVRALLLCSVETVTDFWGWYSFWDMVSALLRVEIVLVF